MPMSRELYYRLNSAFSAVRAAEKEAARLEALAEDERARAQREVQDLYNVLNRAEITLKPEDVQ